jgi:hypothetical protein
METAQKGTKLSAIQLAYIQWCATGVCWPKDATQPLVIDNVSEFGRITGTPRRTLYNWEADLTGFWIMVEEIRAVELNRKLTKYYEWAEISARPITKKNIITGKQELVRAGSAEHLKILLGQSGRKAAEKTETKVEVHSIDSALE